jgi:hypothetical protein
VQLSIAFETYSPVKFDLRTRLLHRVFSPGLLRFKPRLLATQKLDRNRDFFCPFLANHNPVFFPDAHQSAVSLAARRSPTFPHTRDHPL